MEQGYIDKLMDLIDVLGEEAYEEYFDELATMYMYTFNSFVFSCEDHYND